MTPQSLQDFAKRCRGRKIVVAGDVMLDQYWQGTAERLSPEAPVPIVALHERAAVLGGAANVAANAAALGAEVVLVGAIGSDDAGRQLAGLLQDLGIRNQLVEAPRPTTVKTRIVAQGQQVVRVDDEVRDPLAAEYHRAYESALLRAATSADVIILQDYNKGALSEATLRTILHVARSWKIPVVVDPKDRPFSLYKYATVLKPNLREFHAAYDDEVRAQLPIGTPAPATLLDKFEAALSVWNVHSLLVTQGSDGMALCFRKDGECHTTILAAHQVEVADISGAGDTVAAWLGVGLAAGLDVLGACQWANLAAGLQVTKRGTAVVTLEDIAQYSGSIWP